MNENKEYISYSSGFQPVMYKGKITEHRFDVYFVRTLSGIMCFEYFRS